VGAAKIIPTRHNLVRAQQAPEDLPAKLLWAEAVLVRCNGHVLTFEPLYDDPYRVLTRSRNFFRLQIDGRTNTVSTSRLKACLDPAAALAAPLGRGHPPVQWREVTFCWPTVAPPPPRLALPPAPNAVPAMPTGALAAAGPSTPLVPGVRTIFPHSQGFFAHLDPGQEQRLSTPAGRSQRQ
jgi:hypothetical protein